MTETRVLVVDDDPWILRMVSASLGKKVGFIVDTARDGQQALQRVQAAPPALIITDVMMPVMDGWSLVQRLRAHPDYASIPVLFLTALGKEESRLQMLGLAANDYICKPFRFEDLEKRVVECIAQSVKPAANIRVTTTSSVAAASGMDGRYSVRGGTGAASSLERGRVAPPNRHEPSPIRQPLVESVPSNPQGGEEAKQKHSGLEGRLEQLGLSSLLVMMEMERKDGVLLLWEQAESKKGRIFLRQGRVVKALVENADSLDGRQSVYEMLRWKRGRFSFNAMEVEMEDSINTSTTGLLMEGARLIDEANRDS